MSWIVSFLNRLEARLRELIEGDTGRFGVGRKFHHLLEQELLTAMKLGTVKVPSGDGSTGMVLIAPDQYTLVLPSEPAQALLSHPAELDRLANSLQIIAAQSGIRFSDQPMLCVVADPLARGPRILVEFGHNGRGESLTARVDGARQALNGKMPKAFLIVNGLTTYPLSESVINIGCDASNQLRVNDTRVSRLHAQLRLIDGRFVIFDLDSRSGTFVNGVAISSHVLNPGDVIQLAGVPLVYGLEACETPGYTQELPSDPPPPQVL